MKLANFKQKSAINSNLLWNGWNHRLDLISSSNVRVIISGTDVMTHSFLHASIRVNILLGQVAVETIQHLADASLVGGWEGFKLITQLKSNLINLPTHFCSIHRFRMNHQHDQQKLQQSLAESTMLQFRWVFLTRHRQDQLDLYRTKCQVLHSQSHSLHIPNCCHMLLCFLAGVQDAEFCLLTKHQSRWPLDVASCLMNWSMIEDLID